MAVYRVLIEPLAPFFAAPHSRVRKSGALIHSDTLHAALMSVAVLTGSPLLDRARDLRVSSLYPYWESVFFYPKPFLRPPETPEQHDVRKRKHWKSVHLVSERVLAVWLDNDAKTFGQVETLGESLAVLPRDLEGLPPPPGRIAAADHAPAVTVDRCGAGTTPFDRRSIRVNTGEGCGAYFLVDLEEADRPGFEDLVRHLGSQGLGGERSVGYGQFEVRGLEVHSSALFKKDGADAFLTLSLYLPTREEVAAGVLDAPAAYDCALRGGWIHGLGGTDQRKRAQRMCIEGSVLRKAGQSRGEVRDLRPEGYPHPVWRSGLTFGIPCRVEDAPLGTADVPSASSQETHR
jgi:CRISPR-associated protein Csm4